MSTQFKESGKRHEWHLKINRIEVENSSLWHGNSPHKSFLHPDQFSPSGTLRTDASLVRNEPCCLGIKIL